jgi:hypothetical protein
MLCERSYDRAYVARYGRLCSVRTYCVGEGVQVMIQAIWCVWVWDDEGVNKQCIGPMSWEQADKTSKAIKKRNVCHACAGRLDRQSTRSMWWLPSGSRRLRKS